VVIGNLCVLCAFVVFFVTYQLVTKNTKVHKGHDVFYVEPQSGAKSFDVHVSRLTSGVTSTVQRRLFFYSEPDSGR